MYMDHVCFYVCCSDYMGVCGNVCCVAAVVKKSVFFSLGVLRYVSRGISLQRPLTFSISYMSSINMRHRATLRHIEWRTLSLSQWIDLFDLTGIVLPHTKWNHMSAVKHD